MTTVASRPPAVLASIGWLLALIAAAGLGWATGEVAGVTDLWDSELYQVFVAALLAIGLYGSTYGIRRAAAWDNVGAILFAVTIGVALKAVLIMAVIHYLIDPHLTVVGLAVAQIDPLAVSALLRRSGMSQRARAILRSWAAFDDPVTALLAIYAVTLWAAGDAAGDPVDGGVFSYAGGLLANLGLVAAGFVLWRLLRTADDRSWRAWPASAGYAASLLVLVGLLAFATAHFLMLGVALLGLFFRPRLDRVIGGVLSTALLVATFGLGLLMVGGIAVGAGVVLGLAAFLAQMVAAAVLPARQLTRTDRIHLALGQQNGITAIILALALEPLLPGTVAIVAPAVLVVNLLHLATNAWWDVPRRGAPPPPDGDGAQAPAAVP